MTIKTYTTHDGLRVTIPESEHGCPECHGQGKAMLEALREFTRPGRLDYAQYCQVARKARAILRAIEG